MIKITEEGLNQVSYGKLVQMIEMGAFAQIEAQMDELSRVKRGWDGEEPVLPSITAVVWQVGGHVFCQLSTDSAPWRWDESGTWCDGEEDLEEAILLQESVYKRTSR